MRVAAAIVASLLLLSACGRGTDRAGTTITVFAAASLTDAFAEIGDAFESAHPGSSVVFSFAASSALAEQVQAGAPADVIATADERTMASLVERSLVDEPVAFATNSLAIAVPAGNPAAIRSLADLARPGTALVLCAPEVPCGRLARQVLDAAGVTPRPRSLEANVRGVLSKVELGEADAGIVYVTDLQDAHDVERVDIPASQNASTSYLAAGIRASRHHDDIDAFLALLESAEGRRVLRAHGFGSP